MGSAQKLLMSLQLLRLEFHPHHSKSLFSVSDFFSNYCFDSFPLIVSYMQGSSTFEVCEKSLYSQYSQYFVN